MKSVDDNYIEDIQRKYNNNNPKLLLNCTLSLYAQSRMRNEENLFSTGTKNVGKGEHGVSPKVIVRY